MGRSWNDTYRADNKVWGIKPSELAVFACNHLLAYNLAEKETSILDIGCGYGRDSIYMVRNLNCSIIGIDNAAQAIEMARKALSDDLKPRVSFHCCDFKQITHRKYDVIISSNLYQLLEIEDRCSLRNLVRQNLRQSGKLFMSALSTRDPEHYGKGTRISDEENSYIDERFLHFCTREELEKDFSFLTIMELSEKEYEESRSNMQTHHHISWMLFGINE